MIRRRTRHELIVNQNKRNTTFGKRAYSLLKKANELSILCGVDVGLVVHNRGGQDNSILWPSSPVFNERLQNFLNFSDMERKRKMETHEKHLQRTINSEMENVSKSKNKIESKASRQLLSEVTTQDKDLIELDLHQLNGLNLFAEEMLKKLQKRDDELNTNVASTSSIAP